MTTRKSAAQGALAVAATLCAAQVTAASAPPLAQPLPWSATWLDRATAGSNPVTAERWATAHARKTWSDGSAMQGLSATPMSFASLAHADGGVAPAFAGFNGAFFTPTTHLPVSNYTGAAISTDVNNDGHPDLVTVLVDGTINVLLNPGPGQLASMAVSSTNASASSLANYVGFITAADLNGDGYADLVTLDEINYNVVVFINDGHGAFGSGTIYPPIAFDDGANFDNGGNVLVGDVTGDGIPDLVALAFNPVTDQGTGETTTTIHCQVVPGNGDGTFAVPLPDQTTQFNGFLADFAAQSALVDVNHDHKLDLVVEAGGGDDAGAHTFVFAALGNGSGGFSGFPIAFPTSGAIVDNATTSAGNLNPPISFEIVDVDGDGNPDVLFTAIDVDTRNLSVYRTLGNADGSFAPATLAIGGHAIESAANFHFADLDGDGMLDAIEYATGSISVHHGNADGTFTLDPEFRRVTGSSIYPPPAPADFDGDGKPDVVDMDVASSNAGFLVSADGYAGADVLSAQGENSADYPFAMGHLGGAGQSDFLLKSYNQHDDGFNVFFYIEAVNNDGRGHLTYQTALTSNQLAAASAIAPYPVSADLNGDGRLDMLFQTVSGVAIALSNTDGTYQDLVDLPLPTTLQCFIAGIAPGDLNGDGTTDLVLAYVGDGQCTFGGSGDNPPGLFVLLNDGHGHFTSNFTAYGTNPWFPRLADVNGDGKLDLVLGENDPNSTSTGNQLDVIPGNGDGTFDIAHATTPIANLPTVAIIPGDYDHDGKLDLTVGIYSSQEQSGLYRLKGNGDFTFAPLTSSPEALVGTIPSDGAYVDLNGDGYPDLALRLGGGSTSAFGYLLGKADGSFGLLQQTFGWATFGDNTAGGGRALFVADLNGDGSPDVLLDTGAGSGLFYNLSDTIFVNGFDGS